MQSYTRTLLITGLLILMMVLPASAYDYQGTPLEGENNPYNTDSDMIDLDGGELEDFFGSLDIAGLVSLFLSLLLAFLGISLP